MKSLNFFKKANTASAKTHVESLNKNQLAKVIGGLDSAAPIDAAESTESKEKKGLNAVNVKTS